MTWTADEIAAAEREAASWEGTPHMQRRQIKGRGVDCVQLVAAVYQAAGQVPPGRLPQYRQHLGAIGRNPLPDLIAQLINVESIRPEDWEPRTGDITIWRPIAGTNHCGIVAANRIWHASVTQGVISRPLDTAARRLQEILRLRSKGYRAELHTIRLR